MLWNLQKLKQKLQIFVEYLRKMIFFLQNEINLLSIASKYPEIAVPKIGSKISFLWRKWEKLGIKCVYNFIEYL